MARTFSFFPFFIAGYLIPEHYIEKVRSMKKVYAFLAFALAIVSLLVIQKLGVGISALYMSRPYNGMSGIASIGIRLLIIATAFLCIGGFISLASEKHSMISVIGKNSILIYLVHSGLLLALTKVSALKIDNGLVCIAFAAVFSVTICLLFGNEPIARVYRSIIGCISNVLIKRDETQEKNAHK